MEATKDTPKPRFLGLHLLCKIDKITVWTGNSHHRMRRELLDLVQVGLIRQNRPPIALIGSNNNYKLDNSALRK
jgi:hypothetical protein